MNEIKKISSRSIKKPIILKNYSRFSKNNIIAMVPVRAALQEFQTKIQEKVR